MEIKKMSRDDIVLVAARRTPIGAFQGTLSGASATDLGATAIAGAIEAAGIEADDVDQVLMGCVLPAGLGQAPARQAAIGAGIPVGAACTTINKMCGSGMMSMMLGNDQIIAGSAGIVVAGGLESMSNAPFLLPKRLPHGPPGSHRPHVLRRAARPLAGTDDGALRGTDRVKIRFHA
jgi:acetyl-CoA C-acetyltransferase